MHLAANHPRPLLRRCDIRQRVVRVDVAPVLGRGAVIRVGGNDGSPGVCRCGVEPGAVAAIEVPVRVVAEEGSVAGFDDGGEGGCPDPRLHDRGGFRERHVPREQRLFPHDGREALRADDTVAVVEEGLEVWSDRGRCVGADAGLEEVHVGVDLVAAGVEVVAERSDAREEVPVQGFDEGCHGGGVQFELAGWRRGGVGGPVWLVEGGDELRVGVGDGCRVAGGVDLQVALNTAGGSVGLHVCEVCDGPGQAGLVGTFRGKGGEGWDFYGP